MQITYPSSIGMEHGPDLCTFNNRLSRDGILCTQKYTLHLVYRQGECSLSPVPIHALLLLFFASRFKNFKALAFCLFHKLFTHVFRENGFWKHKANRRNSSFHFLLFIARSYPFMIFFAHVFFNSITKLSAPFGIF